VASILLLRHLAPALRFVILAPAPIALQPGLFFAQRNCPAFPLNAATVTLNAHARDASVVDHQFAFLFAAVFPS